MSLTEVLKTKREAAAVNIPQEKYQVMKASTEALKDEKLSGNALKVGDHMIDFELPNANGQLVNFKTLLGKGSLIISFYRGGWCPYCNLELKALQSQLNNYQELGANLVAISPETPDNSLSTSEKNELTFEVLSDVGNVVAKKLGLVFKMPEDLINVYDSFNLKVAHHNGNEDFELPMPATYVVNNEGVITYAFVPEDYTERLDPEAIVEVLSK